MSQVCGRSYGARSRLIEHNKTHSEAKKLKCAYCSKSFSRPHEHAQHERVHTGDKPYRCTVTGCGKQFTSYANWTKHLKAAHAFDKTMIKEVREARERAADLAKSEPIKTESGIESAGSEISDLYGFVESDDSDTYVPIKKIKREFNRAMNPIGTILSDARSDKVGASSITRTVNAAIERIDVDLDLTPPTELQTASFTDFNDVDDSSDIKAIVEHIDALSGGLEIEPSSQGAVDEIMQFTDMMPVENNVYDPGEY